MRALDDRNSLPDYEIGPVLCERAYKYEIGPVLCERAYKYEIC